MWDESGVFTFSFDLSLAETLRGAINEKQKVSFDKEDEISRQSKKISYLAWLRMCACVDRIYDTLQHINLMQIKRNDDEGSAFVFFDFLNHSCVVIDCIRRMGKIFGVPADEFKKVESVQDVFGDVLNVSGTDAQFFEYIRSLCVMHPVDTNYSRHPYLHKAAVHCCPFVRWSHGLNGSGDLYAHVYEIKQHKSVVEFDRQNEQNIFRIPLYLDQFEKYLSKWIEFLAVVIEAIKRYNDSVYDDYREIPIKSRNEFETDIEYFRHLKGENQKRFGAYDSFLFDEYVRVLSCEVSDVRNKCKLERYQNAIRYAISFVHAGLQEMSFEGVEHTGIEGRNETETSLFWELYSPVDGKGEFGKYQYNLSKVYHLIDGDIYERRMARVLLEEIKPLLNKYVYFSNTESDDETVVLVSVARYLSALEKNCILNKNIPNTLRFRGRLLSEEEIESLNECEKEMSEETVENITIRIVDENGNEFDASELELYAK